MESSQEIEFKVGDKAVYPAQGVAEVISIDEKDIAGQRQRFYVLRILDTDRKIMVPVSNANVVGLRQVISELEIREIFDILKERTIELDTQTWNRRLPRVHGQDQDWVRFTTWPRCCAICIASRPITSSCRSASAACSTRLAV